LKRLKNQKHQFFGVDIDNLKREETELHKRENENLPMRRTAKIDIRSLKALVLEKFPRDSPLRVTLLAERDLLSIEEFLAKLETWLLFLEGGS